MVAQRRKVKAGLQVEALEGRQVLSTIAHPVHPAAVPVPQVHAAAVHPAQAHATATHASRAHAAAAHAATIPNPVLVNLTPGVTGIKITDVSFDRRVDVITVAGTIDISPESLSPYYGYIASFPESNYVGISATQAVNRFQSVSGSQYLTESIPTATTTQISFQGRVVASPGEFKSGLVTLSITSSNYFNYSFVTLSVIAQMRNGKAY